MKKENDLIGGELLLHKIPGKAVGDCGHLVDLGAYYIRLHLRENGVKYRYDVCSLSCLRQLCKDKNVKVKLIGNGYVPVFPYSIQRKRIKENYGVPISWKKIFKNF